MDFTRVNRSELVGRATKKTAVLELLVRNNAFNRTGNMNYNFYGEKDGIGFEKVTEKFVDNFLLRTLVPDYNMKNGKNIHVGSQNRIICELLDAYGFERCIVKVVACNEYTGTPYVEMIQR